MTRAIQFAGVVWLFAASAALADQNKPKNPPAHKPAPPPAAAKVEPPKDGGPSAGAGGAGGTGGGVPKGGARLANPENPIDRLRTMTPEQRERVLEKFPPQQQENIRRRLENFDKQTDAQKRRQLGWAEEFYNLPPDKQQLVRQQMKAFNDLPPERRAAVGAAYTRLSNSTHEQRADILSRPQFQQRFSPEELEMLKVLPEYWPRPKN